MIDIDKGGSTLCDTTKETDPVKIAFKKYKNNSSFL